jgi:multidrug efflux system outer membrane protein
VKCALHLSCTKVLGRFALTGIVGAAGCVVGPDYHPAAANTPAAWVSPADGVTDRAITPSSWWTSFNDVELDSLIERAVRSNLDLRVAEARLRQARAVRGGSVADFAPQLNASGSALRQLQSKNQPFFGALPLPANFPFEYSAYQVGFDASWEIDLFGGKRRALEAATAEWQGAAEARNDAMVSLLAEVARNYVELRGGQQRLEVAHRDLKLQQEEIGAHAHSLSGRGRDRAGCHARRSLASRPAGGDPAARNSNAVRPCMRSQCCLVYNPVRS